MDTTVLTNNLNDLKNKIDSATPWLNDKNVVTLIIVALIIFTVFFSKKWVKLNALLQQPIPKMVSLLVLAYLATRNVPLALVATLTFMFTLSYKNESENMENTTGDVVYDSMNEGCMCACDGDNCECNCPNEYGNQENIENMQNMSQEEMQHMSQEEMNTRLVPQEMQPLMDQTTENIAMQNMAMQQVKNLMAQQELANVNLDSRPKVECKRNPYFRDTTPIGRATQLDNVYSDEKLDSDYETVKF